MAKTRLASMSVDALLKLREDIGKVLSQKADQLQDQLSRLGSEVGRSRRGRRSLMKGRKVPREKLKAGAKLEDFAVQKKVVTRKKSKKRRKAKR